MPVCALEIADEQLRNESKHNDELRRAWHAGGVKGHRWLKTWKEELHPALVYCRHLNAIQSADLKLFEVSTSCSDVLLRLAGQQEETLEITMAFRAQVAGANPGYQEALRWEKMHADGWVSATTALVRDSNTRRVEYAGEDIARSLSDVIESWVEGLEWALKKKCRADYGSGKTLLVYGDGLSGDFEYPRREGTLADIVALMDAESWRNGFDRTVIIGWHPGWISLLR